MSDLYNFHFTNNDEKEIDIPHQKNDNFGLHKIKHIIHKNSEARSKSAPLEEFENEDDSDFLSSYNYYIYYNSIEPRDPHLPKPTYVPKPDLGDIKETKAKDEEDQPELLNDSHKQLETIQNMMNNLNLEGNSNMSDINKLINDIPTSNFEFQHQLGNINNNNGAIRGDNPNNNAFNDFLNINNLSNNNEKNNIQSKLDMIGNDNVNLNNFINDNSDNMGMNIKNNKFNISDFNNNINNKFSHSNNLLNNNHQIFNKNNDFNLYNNSFNNKFNNNMNMKLNNQYFGNDNFNNNFNNNNDQLLNMMLLQNLQNMNKNEGNLNQINPNLNINYFNQQINNNNILLNNFNNNQGNFNSNNPNNIHNFNNNYNFLNNNLNLNNKNMNINMNNMYNQNLNYQNLFSNNFKNNNNKNNFNMMNNPDYLGQFNQSEYGNMLNNFNNIQNNKSNNFKFKGNKGMSDFTNSQKRDITDIKHLEELIQKANLLKNNGDNMNNFDFQNDNNELIISKIKMEILALAKDVTGNYALQKILNNKKHFEVNFIIESLKNKIYELTLNLYGCRVVQELISILDNQNISIITSELKPFYEKCIEIKMEIMLYKN